MLSATDAPKSMEAHYPPRPGKSGSRQPESVIICPDPQHRIRTVTLGALARTDVFDHFAPSAKRGVHIPDNSDEGRIVAMTLVVALRRALASVLGVSAAELKAWCVRSG